MNWVVLAIIGIFALSFANISQRVLMKDDKSDPFAYGLVFQFLAAVFLGIFAFLNGFILPSISELGLHLILTGILYAGFTIFILKAYQTTDTAHVIIIMTTRVLWTILGSLLFLQETLSAANLFGIVIMISSIVFVFYNGNKFVFTKGLQYALLAAACFGLGFVNDAFILQKSDALSYTAVSFLLPAIVLILYKPSAVARLKTFNDNKLLGKILLMSIFQATAALTAFMAYQNGGNASQLGPMSLSVVIITTLIAAVFLKERDNLGKKLIGAIGVIIGVYLLL